jgi:hypothetical protein
MKLPDGRLALDFGALPRGIPTTFDDLIRFTAIAKSSTSVTLSLTGDSATTCVVGFWNDREHSVVPGTRSFIIGQTAGIACTLGFDRRSQLGARSGVLIISARSPGGQIQCISLPVTLTVVAPRPIAPHQSPAAERTSGVPANPDVAPTTAASHPRFSMPKRTRPSPVTTPLR